MNENHDIESIFSEAIALADPGTRGDFLDRACEGNVVLRNRIGKLLSASDRGSSFMTEPAGILPDELEETFAAQVPPIGEQPGEEIDRYVLTEELGEGGMGKVFKAEQTEPVRRDVALKVVKPGLDTAEVIARFEAERQALALMSHPHIAQVIDAGATKQGRPYFVMELVDGVAITDYCNDAKLNPQERLELFVGVCDAIQHAHQKGIIHRDIKPRNVLVTSVDGKPLPKVIDFGIAKATNQRLTERTLFTRHGEFIGTPAYMSPEQASRSAAEVDTRSDVYSLGALLYELLTDTPPFDAEEFKTKDRDEVRRLIREQTPKNPSAAIETAVASQSTTLAQNRRTSLRELKSQLNGELDWIVMRCLEKEPDRRYATAAALSDDVQRYLRNDAVVARPVTASYRLRKFLAKNKTMAAAVSAVALTLIVATCISGWLAMNALRSRALADQETESLREVIAFVNDGLLAVGNPQFEANRNIKLRTVLDAAARRLDQQPRFRQPRVEAAIRTTIGTTYHGLGELKQAVSHLRRAHELNVSEFGLEDPKSLESGNQLAASLLGLAQTEEAKKLLEPLVPAAQKSLGNDHELSLTAQRLNGSRLEIDGELGGAEKIFRDLLQQRESALGTSHPDTCHAMLNLASVMQSQGRLTEALELLRVAHRNMSAIEDVESSWPLGIKIATSLAGLHSTRGEQDEAAALYKETVPRAERLLGANHVQTLTARHGLALIQVSQGQINEADAVLSDVLALQEESLGEGHPSTLTTIHNLALVKQATSDLESAEVLLRREVRLRNQVDPSGDLTRSAVSSLAFFYLNQADFAKAIPYYEQAAAAYQGTPHEEFNAVVSLTMLGLCQHKTGEHEQAKANLLTAEKLCDESLQDHWLRYVVSSLLGEVNLELGDRIAAEDKLLTGYDGLKIHEDELPARWKPLGLRAATRRLVHFYEALDDAEQRSRADQYRAELEALRSADPFSSANGQIRNVEDGNSN